MFKIAKSRVVQIAEQKLRAGDREGALALLRQAEAADRPGAFTAKEIRGLHDDPAGVLGEGAYGVVRERFYGGEMLPSKEMDQGGREYARLSPRGQRARMDIMDFNAEGLTNRRVADIVRNNPRLPSLGIQTPQYFGDNAYNMVGQTARDLRNELADLRQGGSPDKMSRQSRNRIAEISRRLRRPDTDAYQVQPMSRLPPHNVEWDDLSANDQLDLDTRFNEGMDHLNSQGFFDTDKILTPQHNVRIGPVGPNGRRSLHLYDFGLGEFDYPDSRMQQLAADRRQMEQARTQRLLQPLVIGNRR